MPDTTIPTFGTLEPDIVHKKRIAAYAVIRQSDTVVAVLGANGRYFLPGGGQESGETAEDTIHREVREELGRTVRLTHKIGEAIQYFYAASDARHYRMHATFFAAEFTGYLPGVGENTLCWLPVSDAPAALFHACHAWAATWQAHQ